MAVDKAIDSTAFDSKLKAVADAIRSAGGTTEPMSFPSGMVEAVSALTGGSITFEDDGSGNIRINGATEQTAKRFLQSLTMPGLDFKYLNPIRSGTYANPYGLSIGSGESLVSAINALTEPGIYTIYQNRASTDVPTEAQAISSSLRGITCLSQINKHYAFIFMMDQDSNFYVQYIQSDVGKGWKKMSTFDGNYESLSNKPTVPTVQDILDALPTWTGGSF